MLTTIKQNITKPNPADLKRNNLKSINAFAHHQNKNSTNNFDWNEIPIQAKLKINAPNDRFEQEANRIANEVVNLNDTITVNETGKTSINRKTLADEISNISTRTPQRKCTKCEEEEENMLQRKNISSNTVAVPDAFTNQLNTAKGGGSAMDGNTKQFMSSRFGVDFSNVRIHNGSKANAMSQSINAKAFTLGNDIYFNKGEYNPQSQKGKNLLAHELVHTVQQRANNARGSDNIRSKFIQRAPTTEIVDENFIGPLTAQQRRATVSCPIICNGIINMGTLHAMGLFYHRSRSGVRQAPGAGDNGVGTALHFMDSGPKSGCSCDEFKVIQVISTSHPAAGRNGSGYVDNGGQSTPFYGDVYASGSGEHTISVGGDFQDKGESVETTHSIYDSPFRGTAGRNTTIEWQAEANVACVRNGSNDHIMGGVSYGFRLPYDTATNLFGTIQGIGPSCHRVPSSNFIRTLQTDGTVSSYNFNVEIGLGDFPVPDQDPNAPRYA